MKTQEQINAEIFSYLNKATNHTFIKPKATFKWGSSTTPGYYEYDYENGTYFKIFKKEDGFYVLENDKLTKLDVDWYIKYCGKNAKCAIKHRLFLDKKMKGVKNTKYVQEQINQLLEPIQK